MRHVAYSASRPLLAALLLLLPGVAFAQDAPTQPYGPAGPETAKPAPATPAAPSAKTVAADVPSDKPKRDPAKFARFDDLREPMLTTRFPGMIDTITGDLGGWRSWLADRDTSIEAQISTNAVFPLRSDDAPRNPQVYNGQRPTLQVHALNIYVTTGLGAIGLPNTKIIVGGGYLITSFEPNGPNKFDFKGLSIYQSFADKAVEIKAGFTKNYLEYVGLFAGGSPTLTNGFSSLIPVQVGLSAEPGATPALNIGLNGKHGLYAKFGVQRSSNPLGDEEEVRHNGIGLAFTERHARPLVIGELGIKQDSALGQRSFWLRGGYIYNSSPYERFLGGTHHNYAGYLLADYQLTQPDDKLFFRGLYAGGSAMVAPKDVNLYAKSADLHLLYVGALDTRPTDAINVTVRWNRYSSDYHAFFLPQGIRTERYQASASGSYAVHFGAGITFVPTLQYIVHPTPEPGHRDAVLGSLNVYLAL